MKRINPFALFAVCAAISACTVQGTARVAQPDNRVWVCHRGGHSTWLRVSARDGERYRGHGDEVSLEVRTVGERCGGGDGDHHRDDRH